MDSLDFTKNTFFILLGFALCLIFIKVTGVPADAKLMRQLIQPCLDQGYTKAKCREMIYIPKGEGVK